ncbi:MAG: hypothetical protein K2X52_09000 [Mycobacteriaceae bacterium]|nr:hypothetical protein [Mycobacteriaceae bacterium]
MKAEWSDEVLFPPANAIGYRLIYEAETWLRRICWTALLLSEGPAWATAIDGSLRKRLEYQAKSNSSRWYLGVDDEEELLWSSTQGQLATLLQMTSIQSTLERICGLSGALLAQRLQSIAHVRNTLSHNRAITDDTLTVLKGDLVVVRAAVQRFKRSTLYANMNLRSHGPDEIPDDLAEFVDVFQEQADAASIRAGQQLVLSANEDFVELTRLPVEPFETWPDGKKLRTAFGMVSHLMLCVLANKNGDEIAVVLPRTLPLEDKREVLKRFVSPAVLQNSWTLVPPEEQDASASCWARLWFYENKFPEHA